MPLPDASPTRLTLESRLQRLGFAAQRLGIVIVDHGSRRAESNGLLLEVVELFRQETGLRVVEPAHMELAEPTIAQAYARCVQQGAETIVVYPYFLLPGRHWHEDIPRLAAEAALEYPHTRFVVPAPLGLHTAMVHVVEDRIADCLRHAMGTVHDCPMCSSGEPCRLRP